MERFNCVGMVQVWRIFAPLDLLQLHGGAHNRLACDFCSSGPAFYLRLPSDSTSQWTPLPFGEQFPLQVREDSHLQAGVPPFAGRT